MTDSPFLEDQALHIALSLPDEGDDDYTELRAVLDKLLPGELMALAIAADVLASEARIARQRQRARV